MTTASAYREMAVELLARAAKEKDARKRGDLERTAAIYRRLADQADKDDSLVVEIELPEDPDPKT
jgi:hypothetical protein